MAFKVCRSGLWGLSISLFHIGYKPMNYLHKPVKCSGQYVKFIVVVVVVVVNNKSIVINAHIVSMYRNLSFMFEPFGKTDEGALLQYVV